jgi:hypothetical protein
MIRAARRGRSAAEGGDEREMGEVISVELQLCGSRGAAPPAGLSEHFASARGHLRRRNDAQGDVGVGDRIEEGFRLRPNVDLRDVCHQRHHTAETRVSRPRLHAALVRKLWASEVGVLQMCDCSYHQRACRQVYCRQLKDSDSKVSQLTKAEHKERRAWLRVRGNRECPIFPSRGGPGYRESGWML